MSKQVLLLNLFEENFYTSEHIITYDFFLMKNILIILGSERTSKSAKK